jgi:hypothetical protein
MSTGRIVLVFAVAALLLAAAGGIYYVKKKDANSLMQQGVSVKDNTKVSPNAPSASQNDQSADIALTTTNFIGGLTPGGTPESAGIERNYVVTYQVAFLRKSPEKKLPEEGLTYQQLMERQVEQFPPYVFYGEIVRGHFDSAHPDSIAVVAKIDKKDVHGFIDSQKLWLLPEISPAEAPRYMSVKDNTAIHVVPDAASPAVLTILQGEVVEVVGRLNFQGNQWIQARFNADEVPRYGFILASDLQPLSLAAVNQSVLTVEEVPHRIRQSDVSLADSDRKKLSQAGFYIESIPPAQVVSADDMTDAYADSRHGRQFFVTSDLFLHVHHLLFDRMLQDVEENKVSPAIKELSAKLAKTTEAELNALPTGTSSDVRNALTYDLVYFSVAAKLFDPSFTVSDPVRSDAEEFLGKIQAGQGELPSALASRFGDEDFTQYKPRSHYEKNETLQRYFRGMMWFGRRNFLLSSKEMTVSAILIPGLLEKAGGTKEFDALDGSLGYLVGPQDKYTLSGYRFINRKVFGTETPSAMQLSTNLDDRLQAFTTEVETNLPVPQIVSAQTGMGKTQEERLKMVRGFKFLGQRYTLDAYFFNQLTSPSVGTDTNPRNLPSALDVMMLLGAPAATEQQQLAQQQNHWANYDAQTEKMQGVAHDHLAKEGNFYESWLSILNSLFLPGPSKQVFTLGKPWQYKNLNAGAASWTELKHDTILYAEQSAAEMGEGDEFSIPPYNPPAPKGYVEPNPLFFHRQAQSIAQMLDRLKHSGMITDEYLDKFTTLRSLAQAAGEIAQKEVSGGTITTEDYAWIENLDRYFGPELILPRGMEISMIKDRSELQMALISDVATDGVEGRVLEVATGTPQRITVVVKDAYGGTRLTVGYVYSWYEFVSRKRWADSEWKAIIYSQDALAKKQNGIETPSWYTMFSKN